MDLIQLHNLVDEAEREQAFAPRGVLEALIEAKEEGLERFIGVTAHGLAAPRMHLRSIALYDFDAVLLPYNFPLMRLPDHACGFEELYQECLKRGIAAQTIKAIARRNYPGEQRYNTWNEPLTEEEDNKADGGPWRDRKSSCPPWGIFRCCRSSSPRRRSSIGKTRLPTRKWRS